MSTTNEQKRGVFTLSKLPHILWLDQGPEPEPVVITVPGLHPILLRPMARPSASPLMSASPRCEGATPALGHQRVIGRTRTRTSSNRLHTSKCDAHSPVSQFSAVPLLSRSFAGPIPGRPKAAEPNRSSSTLHDVAAIAASAVSQNAKDPDSSRFPRVALPISPRHRSTHCKS